MPPPVPVNERKRIVELCLQGISQREICRRTARSRRAVRRAIQAYRDEGGRLEDSERSGRPRATDEESDRLIIAMAATDPFISAKEIRETLNLDISCWTIRRRLKEAGLKNCAAAQKPRLTERQRRLRLEFARMVEQWEPDDWREVVFTDESSFSSRWDQQQRVWRPVNCRYGRRRLLSLHK